MSGSKTGEKEPVRVYGRGTPSDGAVRERPLREPPLSTLLQSRTLLVLLAIMLLGAVLRFYGLCIQSLWSDKTITLWSCAATQATGSTTT